VAGGAGPAALLDAAHLEHLRLPSRHQHGAARDAVLLPALEQLTFQQQCRAGAAVSHDELFDHCGAGALGDAQRAAGQVVAACGDGVAVPDREDSQRAAGERPPQVQVQEPHEFPLS